MHISIHMCPPPWDPLWTPPPPVPQTNKTMSRPTSLMRISPHYTCFGRRSRSGLVWGWGCLRGLWLPASVLASHPSSLDLVRRDLRNRVCRQDVCLGAWGSPGDPLQGAVGKTLGRGDGWTKAPVLGREGHDTVFQALRFVRFDMIYDTIRYVMIWYDMICYDMLCYDWPQSEGHVLEVLTADPHEATWYYYYYYYYY